MPEPLRCVPHESVIAGWDFSTGAVKCLAFDVDGRTVAEVRLPTDLWTADGVSELNLMQLEGQARAATRAIAARLRDLGRLGDWAAGGVSANSNGHSSGTSGKGGATATSVGGSPAAASGTSSGNSAAAGASAASAGGHGAAAGYGAGANGTASATTGH